MKEVQVFENWINQLSEGTWALPETPEQNAKLKELMSKELIVGPDGTNATEQLYDVIGDDELFDRINDLAERDPRANLWDDTDVQQRLQELGIQMPSDNKGGDDEDYYALPDGDRDEQPPIAKQQFAPQAGVKEGGPYDLPGKDYDRPGDVKRKQPSGEHNPYPFSPEEDEEHFREIFRKKREAKDQGVAENTELNTMLKYAGVPLRESVLTDSTGHTLDHILKRFGREVADFEAGAELDNDLFDALYDYYFDDMPYGVKKARTGDPHEWISERLADELGVNEGLMGALAGGGLGLVTSGGNPIVGALGAYAGHKIQQQGIKDPDAEYKQTQKLKQQQKPVAESSCNMTMEGEYCPEHGLAECGMYEMGTVAGSIAPVMGEQAVQDPINYNAAITGSYYEAREGDAVLARIKSLALLK